GRLAANDSQFISDVSHILGKYTLQPLTTGDRIKPTHLMLSPRLNPSPGGAVVPVVVEATHARALDSGMRLAFVKEYSILPVLEDLSDKLSPPGFMLRAMVLPNDKGRIAQLGERWHSSGNALRFWSHSPCAPKEESSRCYA